MSFERGRVAVVVRGDERAVRERTADEVPVLSSGDGAAIVAADVAPADLALVEAGVTVPEGWLDGLLDAVGDDGTVATASAIVLDRPGRVGPPLHPRTTGPTWGCVLVTRAALDLCGPLDGGFAERCSSYGLLHVIADDVLVAGPEQPVPDQEPEPALRARWRARVLHEGLDVTVDARILRQPLQGTQVHTLELIRALHRAGDVRLRALVPSDLTPMAAAALDELTGLARVLEGDVADAEPSAVVHRPYQVTSAPDLLTLRHVGRRLVVTHQDMLLYHVAAYHEDQRTFRDYRDLTRLALAATHRVLAFSHHAAADLRAEGLVPEDRLRVVPIGVDHDPATEPRDPGLDLGDTPYLLSLGTDLRHKNRPFAVALLRALRERGWDGKLVQAGVPAAVGASEALDAVVAAGVPDEAEKAWLYAHAAAVVYPTVYEGFGLVPFEAAAHGVPALFAAQASLAETLGAQARLVPWDADASAERALPLLTPGAERDAHVGAIRAAAAPLTWDATARALPAIYEEALTLPEDLGWAALEIEHERNHFRHQYWSLREQIGPTGLALVGEERLLPEDAQRTLAGLAKRPATRRVLLSTLSGLRRVTKR